MGARAVGMGGAFIGLADDWTAIYWNPGGLAKLHQTGLGFATEVVRIRTHDSNGLANPTAPLTSADIARGDAFFQLGGEPTRFNGTDSSFLAPLPSFGFYTSWHGFTFAGGSYTPLGFAFEVTDASQPGFDVSFKSRGSIINHNFSVARQVAPWISIGAGVNLVQAHLARFANKTAPGYAFGSSAEGSALDVQGLFGILIEMGSHWRLGGVYRTGQDLAVKGNAFVGDSRLPAESSDFVQHVRNPTTYGVGLAFLPTRAMTLCADWQRSEWNASRLDIRFDHPGALLQNQDMDLGWSSTNRYRCGVEWRATDRWSLRGGYFRDPRAVSFETQALTELIDVDLSYFTAGLSYARERWRASIGSFYAQGREDVAGQTLERGAMSYLVEMEFYFGA